MSAPIEYKVSAAAIATAVSGVVVWALQTYAFHGDLPLPVSAFVQTVVPALVALAAGYMAPHTPRADTAVAPEDDPGRHARREL